MAVPSVVAANVRHRIVLKNMPASFSWRELKAEMRRLGDVIYADIDANGDGVVEFATADDLEYAIRRLHGSNLDGNIIKVCRDGASTPTSTPQVRTETSDHGRDGQTGARHDNDIHQRSWRGERSDRNDSWRDSCYDDDVHRNAWREERGDRRDSWRGARNDDHAHQQAWRQESSDRRDNWHGRYGVSRRQHSDGQGRYDRSAPRYDDDHQQRSNEQYHRSYDYGHRNHRRGYHNRDSEVDVGRGGGYGNHRDRI